MLVGQQIGPFEIERELGSGAMGTVYRAKFNKDGKLLPVALKVVALGLLGNESAMARFDREAGILKQLKHKHIVRLYATGHYKKTPFIAMEFIDGEALDRVLARKGRLGWEEVCHIGKHLCLALQHAHEKGIIHRDLKPSNLMLTRDNVLKLTDFGIAKDMDLTALTAMNSTIGTAAYMSPEQCKGDRNITSKSDLYSLGIVLFELLTGKKPFMAETTVDMFLQHVNKQPPRVSRLAQDVPPKLERLILQLLEKDKDQRPLDAAWVARILEEIEQDAFHRQSAGHAAATARRGDVIRGGTGETDATDRDAVRAIKQKKKKHKKAAPLLQQKWFQATAIIAALLVMIGGAYYMMLPPSAKTMYEAVEKAETRDERLEAARAYLDAHGDDDGEQTDRVAAIYRREHAQQLLGQLESRVTKEVFLNEPMEGADPNVYRQAIAAIQAEQGGRLGDAGRHWGDVKAGVSDAAAKPFALDEETLNKAKWGWAADSRLADIGQAKEAAAKVEVDINEITTYAKPTSPDSADPKAVAVRATRLQNLGDRAKARRLWNDVVEMTKSDPEKYSWTLLAYQNLAGLPEEPEPTAAQKRTTLIDGQLEKATTALDAAKAEPTDKLKWLQARRPTQEIVDLYQDDRGQIESQVARAKAILAEIDAKSQN